MRRHSLYSWRVIIPLMLGLTITNISYAENYYRWVSEDGVVHYGSRPPEGVEVEKISTFGKSAGKSASTEYQKESKQATADEQQAGMAAAQKKQCDEETTRLGMLKSPGRRIRMEQADGSSRYLSVEELSKEIASSQEFIEQACK